LDNRSEYVGRRVSKPNSSKERRPPHRMHDLGPQNKACVPTQTRWTFTVNWNVKCKKGAHKIDELEKQNHSREELVLTCMGTIERYRTSKARKAAHQIDKVQRIFNLGPNMETFGRSR
jgi:hypothetical protein